METHGRIDAADAARALDVVRHSRARVAWSGYPAWYWVGTAACLAALPLAMLLPVWLGAAACAAVGVVLFRLIVAAGRVRGVCEHWARGAMRMWEVTALYGPPAAIGLACAVVARFAWWAPIVAAVAVFVLFAGTGLTLSARAARR